MMRGSSHSPHPAPSARPLPYGKGGASLSRGTARQPHRGPSAPHPQGSAAPSARPIPDGYRHEGRPGHADGVHHMAPVDMEKWEGANIHRQPGVPSGAGHFAKHGRSGRGIKKQPGFDAGYGGL